MKLWYTSNVGKNEIKDKSKYKEVFLMGIFDVTDSFESQIKMEGFTPENIDKYISGVKDHTQPLVTFANQGKDVIYREQL